MSALGTKACYSPSQHVGDIGSRDHPGIALTFQMKQEPARRPSLGRRRASTKTVGGARRHQLSRRASRSFRRFFIHPEQPGIALGTRLDHSQPTPGRFDRLGAGATAIAGAGVRRATTGAGPPMRRRGSRPACAAAGVKDWSCSVAETFRSAAGTRPTTSVKRVTTLPAALFEHWGKRDLGLGLNSTRVSYTLERTLARRHLCRGSALQRLPRAAAVDFGRYAASISASCFTVDTIRLKYSSYIPIGSRLPSARTGPRGALSRAFTLVVGRVPAHPGTFRRRAGPVLHPGGSARPRASSPHKRQHVVAVERRQPLRCRAPRPVVEATRDGYGGLVEPGAEGDWLVLG